MKSTSKALSSVYDIPAAPKSLLPVFTSLIIESKATSLITNFLFSFSAIFFAISISTPTILPDL